MLKNRGKSKLSNNVLFNANKHVFHCEKSLGTLFYGQPSYIVLNTINIVSIFFSEQNSVVQLGFSVTLSTTVSERFVQFFHQVFLPQGYPRSVSDDYYRYQLWDTLQVSSL
jgi:hypothetical protein